jgi:hypothetical protein
MFALLGDSERARPDVKSLAEGNTLYREAGPCIETPLFAIATIQDSLLTWDRRGPRLFAGTPDDWQKASFVRLRAPLGLSVSAHRENGRTRWVHIQADATQTVRMEARFAAKPEVRSSVKSAVKDIGHGWIEFDAIEGQEILFVEPGWKKPVGFGNGG